MVNFKLDTKRASEIVGVIFFALAIFLFLCLLSYHPEDPSLSHYETVRDGIHNLGGVVGSYTADTLYRSLGVSALWLPVFLLLTAFKVFRMEEFRLRLSWFLGLISLTLATAALISHLFGTAGFRGYRFDLGGMFGTILAEFFNSYLNAVGTFILLAAALVISLIVTVDLHVVWTTQKAGQLTGDTAFRFRAFLERGWERFQKDRRRAVEKKVRQSRPEPIIKVDEKRPPAEKPKKKKPEQATFDFIADKATFSLPPITLLDHVPRKDTKLKKESLLMNSRLLERKLADFGVEAKVVEVKPGPLITLYELEPAPGVKINKIANLSDDLALALKAPSVRIIAPIPGKAVVGIEIPNLEREPVQLKDVLDNETFLESKTRLPIALGEDTIGGPVISDLTKMPHLLIAGTTGSGKSVFLNALICSILFKAPPDEVKFIMIDPKRLELSGYEGIPHLLHPVVVDPREASYVLRWAVEEMERRYRIIGETGTRSIEKFNRYVDREQAQKDRPSLDKSKKQGEEAPAYDDLPAPREGGEAGKDHAKLPYIVIVIDELADLMMVAQRNVEESLTRLAQMARAAGIHLILATQRPSVDVITGIIKANFPTRISFQVSSKVDSRTILDQLGAEQLLGTGDMLFLPPGLSKVTRIHGSYVSEGEIGKIVAFIRKQARPIYDESILKYQPESGEGDKRSGDFDEKYDEAVELVTDLGQASISLVQRYLKIGYNRAARIIEKMESEGIVGPSDGVKPRKVLAKKLPR
ncbi:MAG: DNA translocase FtsK 4TM domain-containing protein [Deltaproteobacteria bacterium]|nr:DNA translocase FtsK 4TM domain-containing protein [Deltaproteobacteria bacterium]